MILYKKYIVFILIVSLMTFMSCENVQSHELEKGKSKTGLEKEGQKTKESTNKPSSDSREYPGKGYLYINIDQMYYKGGQITIYNKDGDSISIRNKVFTFDDRSYDIKDELPNNLISCTSFDPEYGLFVTEFIGYDDLSYNIIINDDVYRISKAYSNMIDIKTQEEYIMSGYPVLNNNTPLRKFPNDTSELVVDDFSLYSYKPLNIKGDWLEIVDDKDCPLKDTGGRNIRGWIKWREYGEVIIKIALLC